MNSKPIRRHDLHVRPGGARARAWHDRLNPRPLARVGILAFASLQAPLISQGELAAALETLRAVGPEGRGNDPAARAWMEVASAGPEALPRLLEAMNRADPRACNYLRVAILAIADRQAAPASTLPIAALGGFLLDTRHDSRPRRLAFDLLQRADPTAAERLLAGLLDDPAPELRREAVQRLVSAAAEALAGGRKEVATVLYRQALGFARDAEQIGEITGPLKDLGQPVDLVQVLGFLTHWKVIGPFDNTGRAGFERVFPPERELDLQSEYDGKDGKVRWKDFTTTHEYGMVDFNKAYAPLKEVTGYAFTEFYSDTARPAELRIGCKNGWKLWYNGQFVFGRDEYHRSAEIDQYRYPIELRAGRNTILVKLTQDEEKEEWTVEWEFQLRVTDPGGRVIRSAAPATKVASITVPGQRP